MQNKQLECAGCEYSGKIPEFRDCPDAYTEVAAHCKKYQDITKRKESNNAIRNRN